MKVKDFMQKTVVTISPSDPASKAIKTIFNLGFNSVPVVDKKKIIGIVTDDDILKKLFPSVSEFMTDMVSGRNFEAMEINMHHLMNIPVADLMTNNVVTITPSTPIMKAQSLMLLHDFTHIPVVEKGNKLVGIISQGDIFKALVEHEIPYNSSEEYTQWLATHWDLVIPWEERLNLEIPSIVKALKKFKVKNVIDVFCGTGEHAISFAKHNYDVLGLNRGTMMHKRAVEKFIKLSPDLKSRLKFRLGDYKKLITETNNADVFLFLGNSLGHLTSDYDKVLRACYTKLNDNGIVIFQIANLDLVLSTNRLQNFVVAPSRLSKTSEYAFLQFYDPPKHGSKFATLTMSILFFRLRRWQQKALNSTPVVYFNQKTLSALLKKVGFSSVQFYGSDHFKPLFDHKFDPKAHKYMNVLARK